MQPQRYSLIGQSGSTGLARWSARTVLAWIGLFVVVSTGVYGLHGAAAALAPNAPMLVKAGALSHTAVEDAVLVDDAALELQGESLDATFWEPLSRPSLPGV
jgi:hypothetical protein